MLPMEFLLEISHDPFEFKLSKDESIQEYAQAVYNDEAKRIKSGYARTIIGIPILSMIKPIFWLTWANNPVRTEEHRNKWLIVDERFCGDIDMFRS